MLRATVEGFKEEASEDEINRLLSEAQRWLYDTDDETQPVRILNYSVY